jgi:hypothetical protein
MRNNTVFKIVLFSVFVAALGTLVGSSFSPILYVIGAGRFPYTSFADVLSSVFGGSYFAIFVVFLLLVGAMTIGLFFPGKRSALLGNAVGSCASGFFLFVIVHYLVSEGEKFQIDSSETYFEIYPCAIVVMVAIVCLILLSLFSFVVCLLPERKAH